MTRLILFGATGALGSHVLRQALDQGHQVTVFVRSPERLPDELASRVTLHVGDLGRISPTDLARLIDGHDALINCAGFITDGQVFVDLVERLVSSLELLPKADQPVCWFLAGAAILDMDRAGRRAVGLPRLKSTYWPHQVNFDRLQRTDLDWRLLCPGPMVEQPALGLNELRITLDVLPVRFPAYVHALPAWLFLPIFAYRVPEMIVPYADAAALMLDNLADRDIVSQCRVGLALPVGMRGKRTEWAAPPHQPA